MHLKLRNLIRKHRDWLIYLVFGVLTTLVNYLVYLPLLNIAALSGALSNAIAWGVAVAFAFLTNKPFVFKSRDWSLRVTLPELIKFVGSRIASGFIETAVIYLTVDMLNWNGNIWKVITSVLVVILNYITSKVLVFRKGE